MTSAQNSPRAGKHLGSPQRRSSADHVAGELFPIITAALTSDNTSSDDMTSMGGIIAF
jgi:hypothetical protein